MKIVKIILLGSFALTCLAGCVTKKVFNRQMQIRDEQIVSLENELESNESRIDKHEKMLEELSVSTKEAMDRAEEAGKLAQGKFLYEVVLSDESCKFSLNQTELEEECRQILDTFVTRVRSENKNVFIEIQGHTDASGDENVNLLIGQKRAESVFHYLGVQGLPLHRMNVISYGETAPIADNSTKEGRQENRRVVIVVLE